MNALKDLFCKIFGYCLRDYSVENSSTIQRIDSIDRRVTKLERRYWKPRDLLDIR